MREKKQKKKVSPFLILFCLLMVVTLLLCATVAALWLQGRSAMTHTVTAPDLSEMDESEEQEGPVPEDTALESYTIRYNGKQYRYNENMCNILLMGIDLEEKPEEPLPVGSNAQVDVLVLAALDIGSGEMTLINLSRDTMCQIELMDESGSSLGFSEAQLALSFAYGDGLERSCELSKNAVSDLFYGLQIHGYGAYYLGGIADLNDALGGVPVTVLDDYPYFTLWFPRMKVGRELTLTGEEAQAYIQCRDETADGNAGRMGRQRQYMLSMISKAKEVILSDPTQIVSIYNAVDDYVTTDLTLAEISYLATEAAGMQFSGEILSLPGEAVVGAGNHLELRLDEQALYELILDVFYVEVTE